MESSGRPVRSLNISATLRAAHSNPLVHALALTLSVCRKYCKTSRPSFSLATFAHDTNRFEVVWDTSKFNDPADWPEDGSQPFVWSFGDPTGYANHADCKMPSLVRTYVY
jgi:hypothetical protein